MWYYRRQKELQGGVEVPTGSKACVQTKSADPVRFRSRRYSPDERSDVLFSADIRLMNALLFWRKQDFFISVTGGVKNDR